MELSGQRRATAAFYSRQSTPGTHWVGGWVGLRAGLDKEAGGKFFASAGDRPPVVKTVVR
jgi:hypothetical protein